MSKDLKLHQRKTVLLKEAVKFIDQMDTLGATVLWESEEVDKHVEKYSIEEIDLMTDEEKAIILRKSEELYARLSRSVEELRKIEKKYDELRLKVLVVYGEDILPAQEPFLDPRISNEEIDLGGSATI